MRNVILTGAILGLVAGAVVWFLERFEANRLHAQVREYLHRYDEFQDWLKSRPGASPE